MNSVTQITCADDLATLAGETSAQVWKTKRFSDLIGAVLMANHVADWHFQNDLKRKFGDLERTAMKAAYPEWEILRRLANGTKHCKLQPTQGQIEWEDNDFWHSPGHVGGDELDWFVYDANGERRSVAVIISTFLEKFVDRSTRPK